MAWPHWFNLRTTKLPGALITAGWLQGNLKSLNILCASFAMQGSNKDPAADFNAAHIPGARFFSIEHIADHINPLPHMLPRPEAFADAMRALGFDERLPTIIYDDGSVLGACRAWWMLRCFGYDRIALLDGGLPAWQSAGCSVTDTAAPARRGRFTTRFRPELVWSISDVQDNLAAGNAVLLDARSAARFKGEQPEPRAGLRRGHIPGSLNLPYSQLLDPMTGGFLAVADMEILLQQTGINRDEPIVATCGSGVSACVIVFALHLLGRSDIPVYDGSWAEWGGPPTNPAMLGPGQRLKAAE